MTPDSEGDKGSSLDLPERALGLSLDRITRSPQFANSPRLQRLLRYLVERSLCDDQRALHEFSIGIDVFDRDGNFDPGHDTIVRVTACRLRRRLADYYADSVGTDPVRFRLPKGHYRVEFERPPAAGQRGPPVARAHREPALAWPVAAAVTLLVTICLGALHLSQSAPARHISNPGFSEIHSRADLAAGQHLFNRRGPGDVIAARDAFKRVLAIDPVSVPAWVGLAGCLRILALEGGIDYGESLLHQQTALIAALSLQPEHPEANVRMAHLQHRLGNERLFRQYFRTAIRGGNESALVQSIAAGVARRQGDIDEAIRLQRKAVSLEPLSTIGYSNLGHYLYQAGKYDEALAQFYQARRLNPPLALEFDRVIAKILLLQGRYAEAESILATMPAGAGADQLAALLHHATGREFQADEALQSLLARESREAALMLAEVYAFRNQPDRAMEQILRWHTMVRNWRADEYLAASAADRELRQNPSLASLHGDPRWRRWSRAVDAVLTPHRTREAELVASDR